MKSVRKYLFFQKENFKYSWLYKALLKSQSLVDSFQKTTDKITYSYSFVSPLL